MGGTLTVWSKDGRRHRRGALHPVAERVCENATAALAVASVRG